MDRLCIQLESTPEAPTEARAAVRRALADRLPAPVLYDLLLAVTELVHNDVEHGAGAAIEVRVIDNGNGTVRGEVEGGGEPALRMVDPSPDFTKGLGLRIVDAVAETWGRDERTVWFELRRD